VHCVWLRGRVPYVESPAGAVEVRNGDTVQDWRRTTVPDVWSTCHSLGKTSNFPGCQDEQKPVAAPVENSEVANFRETVYCGQSTPCPLQAFHPRSHCTSTACCWLPAHPPSDGRRAAHPPLLVALVHTLFQVLQRAFQWTRALSRLSVSPLSFPGTQSSQSPSTGVRAPAHVSATVVRLD
jgi:hypothetical protein